MFKARIRFIFLCTCKTIPKPSCGQKTYPKEALHSHKWLKFCVFVKNGMKVFLSITIGFICPHENDTCRMNIKQASVKSERTCNTGSAEQISIPWTLLNLMFLTISVSLIDFTYYYYFIFFRNINFTALFLYVCF